MANYIFSLFIESSLNNIQFLRFPIFSSNQETGHIASRSYHSNYCYECSGPSNRSNLTIDTHLPRI